MKRRQPKQPRQINNAVGTLPKENSEAVPVKEPPRSYNISTLIKEEAGELLDQMWFTLRRKEKRRNLTRAEILERGLRALAKELQMQ